MFLNYRYLYILVLLLIAVSCDNDFYPKPKGYFRIDLPGKEYKKFDSIFPYTFEYPVYSKIVADNKTKSEPFWINIDFPQFHGRLHISYKTIDENFAEYIEDTRNMVMKHIPKANSIENTSFENIEKRVFGVTYNISGAEAASPYQFFVTDSVKHFVRGALYFNVVPNNDSLAPVIEFIKYDIDHLVETLSWKNPN